MPAYTLPSHAALSLRKRKRKKRTSFSDSKVKTRFQVSILPKINRQSTDTSPIRHCRRKEERGNEVNIHGRLLWAGKQRIGGYSHRPGTISLKLILLLFSLDFSSRYLQAVRFYGWSDLYRIGCKSLFDPLVSWLSVAAAQLLTNFLSFQERGRW